MGVFDYINQDPYAMMPRGGSVATSMVPSPSAIIRPRVMAVPPVAAPTAAQPAAPRASTPYVPIATRPNTSAAIASAASRASGTPYVPISTGAATPVPTTPRGPQMPTVLPQSKPPKPFTPIPGAGARAAGPTAAQMQAAMAQQQATAQQAQQPAEQGGLLGSGFDDPRSIGIMSAASALLKAGAPVVGQPAPSLGSALGDALGAFQTGYTGAKDSQLNNEYKRAMTDKMIADLKKPKRTSLAGGAYSLIENPDGTTEIVKNEGIQEAILEQKRAEADIEVQTAERKEKAKNPLGLSKTELELDKKMAQGIPIKQQALADWSGTREKLISLKGKIDGGFLTGLLSSTDATGTWNSQDQQDAKAFLEGLAQKLAKARNGAKVTDADVTNAKRSIPNLYMDGEIFDQSIDRLVLEFDLAQAQLKAEQEYLATNKTFKGYEPPTIINGVIVTRRPN